MPLNGLFDGTQPAYVDVASVEKLDLAGPGVCAHVSAANFNIPGDITVSIITEALRCREAIYAYLSEELFRVSVGEYFFGGQGEAVEQWANPVSHG